MDSNFDFDKIGKRMPYKTPDGFFDKLEEDIMAQALRGEDVAYAPKAQSRLSALRIAVGCTLALAASLALFLIINSRASNPVTSTMEDVDMAFCQPSLDDQEFLTSLYQDDAFMSE